MKRSARLFASKYCQKQGYFIKVVEDAGKYIFQLWYIAKQEMGYSRAYSTYKECEEGVEKFKKYLINCRPTEENGLVKIEKLSSRDFIYEFFDRNGEVLYTSRHIETKANCKKSALSTCKNFVNADIKDFMGKSHL